MNAFLNQLRRIPMALVVVIVVARSTRAAGPRAPDELSPPATSFTERPDSAKDASMLGHWGAADGGVRIHANVTKKQWRPDEKPEIELDLTNGKGGLKVRRIPYCEVEVDGIWYVPRIKGPIAGAYVLSQASSRERFAAVRLDPRMWVLKSDPDELLRLTAGKHTVRIACQIDTYRPISQSVDLVIESD